MKIKTGDEVIIIAGKDIDKKGKVLRTIPAENKVVVEGVNVVKRHQKPQGPQSPGGIIEKENPIDVSKVMYFDAKAGKRSRLGYKIEDGKKVRISKASGEEA